MNDQLTLWDKPTLKAMRERAELVTYWRESLHKSLKDIWFFRHNRGATGWSTGVQAWWFARWLWNAGQIDAAELRRWGRLFRLARRRWRRDYRSAVTA